MRRGFMNFKLPLTCLIEWLSPAYALRKLEILFSDCPMGCNAYCIQNFGIRFTHIPMPPVTFNEKGESQIPDYSKTTVRQKTADLTSLTHFRILTILRNAEDIRKREKRLKDAMKDYKIHSEFVKTILNNRTRNRYYRTYFSDMLPEDPKSAIPIPMKKHCIDNIPSLDCFISKIQSACRKTKEALIEHTKNWKLIRRIPCWWMYDYHPLGKDDENPKVWQVRKLVWDFKASNQHEESIDERIQKNRRAAKIVAQTLSRHLRSNFGEDLQKLTFVCAPASCQETHELRYKYFSELLWKIVAQTLSRHLRSNFGEDLQKLTFVCAPASCQETHELRYKYFSELLCRETGMENANEYIRIQKDGQPKHTGGKQKARMFVHPLHIRDKFVLIFDDIITRGNTLDDFKAILEHHGADIR